MQFWIIQGLNSLSLGALLFLLASGFSLIFGLMRLANLTHGAFFMLGTYFGATALRQWSGLNIWVTALGAGIAVAALGGVLGGPILSAYPGLDADMLPLALIVVILGGIGSLLGAFVGSFIIGFIYTFGTALFPELAYIILFLPMIVVIAFRPQGLFGRVGA